MSVTDELSPWTSRLLNYVDLESCLGSSVVQGSVHTTVETETES